MAKQAKKRSKSGPKPGTGAVRKAKRRPSAGVKPRTRAASPARYDRTREKLIFSSINKIAAEPDLDKLLLLLANMGRDLSGADRCTVWLCDQKTGTLWSRVAHGVPPITILATQGIAGWVAAHGEPLIINDPYSDGRFDKDVDKRTGYLTRSILALPMRDTDGRTLGVFQAINKMTGSRRFTEDDREHLQLAASFAGAELKTAQREAENEATQREVIFTMAEAGEMRSKETGQHVKRVAEYCRLFAEKRGLPAAEVDILRQSSPLHDIGKIAIPDAILLKPARLDDAEMDEMRKHSTYGHDMLRHSERGLLRSAAIIAWQHHERWNGKGYPCGLAGTGIHIYGRITALADVFDALASDRPYKQAWELTRIVELFQAERGAHFDPDLTDIFLGNVDEFAKIRNTYKDEPENPAEPLSCPDP